VPAFADVLCRYFTCTPWLNIISKLAAQNIKNASIFMLMTLADAGGQKTKEYGSKVTKYYNRLSGCAD
jgi:hypothetical protein